MADDHTFLDIVPRANPENANLDIVVIHGLNPKQLESNAYSTWTCKKKKEKRNWITDEGFLPTVLPQARIMVFGYNSHAVFKSSEANINEHAVGLLRKIRHKRAETASRPLIFVCHSLGGLLAKRALIVAALPSSQYEDIFQSTLGMVFFATPHGGSSKSDIGKIATRIGKFLRVGRDNRLMEALGRSTLCSEATRDDFKNICKNMQIVSFVETKSTLRTMVVEKEDAKCGLPSAQETVLTLNADHSGICQFWDPDGRDFATVKEEIEDLAKKVVAASNTVVEPAPVVAPKKPILYFVPYWPNPKFHGRGDDIAYMKRYFLDEPGQSLQKRVVLQGFPGIGKTSIAIQYAALHTDTYEGIFWITADSKEHVSARLEELNDAVKKATGEKFQTLHDWCRSHRWLLIIDNLNDPAQFDASLLIPQGPGHIIITTRRTDLSQLGTIRQVYPLDPKDASQLLLSYAEGRRREDNEEIHALQICKLLGCVPLAIRHCGCFVGEQQSRLSSYVVEFDNLMTELVVPEGMEGSLDNFSMNEAKPILATFEVSFAQILRVLPDAAALLELFANLDPTDISLGMLDRCLDKHSHWNDKGNVVVDHVKGMRPWLVDLRTKSSGNVLLHSIRRLVVYSFIFPKVEEGHYFLHPLTHFFLRWRQEKANNVQPFIDTSVLLLNGFPHPDFNRIYGLSSEHAELRETFMPHVKHLASRFAKVQDRIDDEERLSDLATVLLHASEVPNELRSPAKWRQDPAFSALDVQSIPADIRSQIQETGHFVETFVQDTSLLPVIETILQRLDYPTYLFFQAIYVFFHHISTTWMTTDDLALCGRSVQHARQELFRKQLSDVTHVQNIMQFKGVVFDPDIFPLLPLEYKQETSPEFQVLDRESGMLGLIAVRYTSYLRKSVFSGHPITLSAGPGGGFNIVMDNRWLLPAQIPCAWIVITAKVFKSDTPQPCDLYNFAQAQLDLLAFEAIRDTHLFPLVEKRVADRAVLASLYLSKTFQPESVAAASALFLLLYEWTERMPPLTKLPTFYLRQLLDAPVTKRSYYFKVKLVDAWMDHLKAHEKWDDVEALLLHSLELFRNASQEVGSWWPFRLDPVLDVFEFLIVFFTSVRPDHVKAEEYREQYRNHFEEQYGDTFYQRLALGCGVGVFGTSFCRLRIPEPVDIGRPRTDSEQEGLLQFFEDLRRVYGPSGTSLPLGKDAVPRYVEAEWSLFRYEKFLELVLGEKISFNTITLGEMDFGRRDWKEGIPMEAFDDEEMNIRMGFLSLFTGSEEEVKGKEKAI